jgi:GalNAc-alpha-(1->4)-GalNAc-alpha-(1->3)-diNAcBac-PP-undecaprenol alpha-1,4-N-acetyl-D-galactosaminyltransferase
MNIQRILFVIPTMQQGGAERVVSVMANFWAKNYKVTIISFDDNLSFYPLDKQVDYYNLKSSKKRSSVFTVVYNNIVRAKNYFAYVKKTNPNVIISFTRNANMYCILYNFFLKKSLIVGETTNPNFPILPTGMNNLPRFIYKFATAIVVQTVESLKIFAELKIQLPKRNELI